MVETLKPSSIECKKDKKIFINKAKEFTKKTITSLAIAGTLFSFSCDTELKIPSKYYPKNNDICIYLDENLVVPEIKQIPENDYTKNVEYKNYLNDKSPYKIFDLLKSLVKKDNLEPDEIKDYTFCDEDGNINVYRDRPSGPLKDEKSVSLFNKFIVTYPDREDFHEIAESTLMEMFLCYEQISKNTGLEIKPLNSNMVAAHIIIDENPIAGGYADINTFYISKTNNDWVAHMESLLTDSKYRVDIDMCSNLVAHEMMHVFFGTFPYLRALGEGIAMYSQYRFGTSKNNEFKEEDFCLEDKIYYPFLGNPENYPETASTEYAKLSGKNEFGFDERNYWYYTAQCAIYDILNYYGFDSLKEIASGMEKHRISHFLELPDIKKSKYIEIIEESAGKKLSQELLDKYQLNRNELANGTIVDNVEE